MTEIIIPNPSSEPGERELAQQRRVTSAFISQKPDTITFIPRTKSKKPAGGWVWVDGTPKNPQIVSFIEVSASGGNPVPIVTLDGLERRAEMEIVAEWDADVDRYDVFTHQGKDWEVIDLFYDNGYETRAWVSGRG
jgi:hypothetical protein